LDREIHETHKRRTEPANHEITIPLISISAH